MRATALAFLVMAAVLAATPAEVGHTTKVIRAAELLRGKSTTPLKENEAVAENDRLRTQSSGRVRVVLNDGSILNVGSSSMLTIRGDSEISRSGSLEMAYGRLRAMINSNSKEGRPYEVRTATAVCGVLGTTLFVDSSRDLTRIANLSEDPNSRVRVTGIRAAGEVILMPGQGTSVPAARAPQPPRRWSPEEIRAANADTDLP